MFILYLPTGAWVSESRHCVYLVHHFFLQNSMHREWPFNTCTVSKWMNEWMNKCTAGSSPYPSPAGNMLDTPGSQAKTDCRNSSLHIGHSGFPQSLLGIDSDHRLCTGVKGTPQGDSHRLQNKGQKEQNKEKKEKCIFSELRLPINWW